MPTPKLDPEEWDDLCPDGWAIGHPTLPEVSTYFKCCRLAYTHYERKECPKQLLQKFRLQVVHKYRDASEQVAYTIHARVDHGSAKPLELIVSFRGLIESFEFVDLNPLSAPSNSALNRRVMLLGTDTAPIPSYCGDCPGARIHGGILGYFQRMEGDIHRFLRGPEGFARFGDIPLVATGFSMGCGLASLGSLVMKRQARLNGHQATVQLVNFCSPKLGNRAFANFAFQQLDTYDCYYIRDDPVASYPPEEEYVLPGNIIVMRPIGEDRYFTRASWTYEGYPYAGRPPTGSHLVTDSQMALGLWKESAIPGVMILPALKRCHVMAAVRDVLSSRPVKRQWVERLKKDYEALHPQPPTNWLDPHGLFAGCPMPMRRSVSTTNMELSCPVRRNYSTLSLDEMGHR